MNRSPLHDLNREFGARFVDFGGWEMPVQYEGVLAEHRSVRNSVGVFDVTHLGRFELSGAGAHAAARRLLCNDIERIEPGRCQYTLVLNGEGGVIDDLIVWWWDPGRYWVMPNAANHERVMAMFSEQPGCAVRDLQTTTVFLAVQGPEAIALLHDVIGQAPRRFRNIEGDWGGDRIWMAGTGYTGEPGAEICLAPKTAAELMRALIEGGAVPCGLGSRDTLRLEAGLPLWGEDIDESTTPLEAGLDFAVSLQHEFVGREALERQGADGLQRRLAGFVLTERGIPRHGHTITTDSGGSGSVTSGNMSPLLETGVGLAYLSPPTDPGEACAVAIRDRQVRGRIAKPPFHES
jgi:aminomethyltransferase